jgi:tetratricopeptide (TPR) repeat protein
MIVERASAILLSIFLLSAPGAGAQPVDRLSVRAVTEAVFPAFGDEQYYAPGVAGSLALEYQALPFLSPLFRAGVVSESIRGSDVLTIAEAALGVGVAFSPIERLLLRLDGTGGLYAAYRGDLGVGNLSLGTRAEIGFRVSPALSLAASAGIARYFGPSEPLLTAISAGMSATLHLGALGAASGRVRIEDVQVQSVYPVFYSFYDDHPFGSLSVVNGEENEIKDVRVSFSMGQYMSQPKSCGEFASLARGGSVEVPVYALFNDDVLSLTENTRAPGELVVDYTLLGSHRQTRAPIVLQFLHRNAMNWDDDRKAAAFVSPTDPAALWFAKFVTGIVRDRARTSINRNLQLAIGLFEAERLYGINYVIDPSSSYVEKSAKESSVDYLQYPYQTLFYRGGDCDDLSILFSALLESVGIKTAFITIPGHIYMAFSLEMSEAEARSAFFDPSILIYHEGQAWVPLEITMVKEGFVKAWRVGAKEWVDNKRAGTATFLPMERSWALFAPVGIPDINPRFSMPEEVSTIQAFDESVNRYVAKEIDPAVLEHRARHGTEGSPEAANELGILYGRYGMLKEAWAQFSLSARGELQFAWTNLGSVAFLRKDYPLALSYYRWALGLDPRDTAALLGVARSEYELEHFVEADAAYAELKAADPQLAAKYGYLGSMFGGTGRAWSFADRLSTTVWDEPSRLALAPRQKEPAVAPVQEEPRIVEAPAVSLEPTVETLAAPQEEQLAIQAPPPVIAELPPDADLASKAAPAVSDELPVDRDLATIAPQVVPATQESPMPVEEPVEVAAVEIAPLETPQPVEVAAAPVVEEQPIEEMPVEVSIAQESPPIEAPAPVVEEQPIEETPAEALIELESPPVEAPAPEIKEAAAESLPLKQGFKGAFPVLGTWIASPEAVDQTDKRALFAKLAIPLAQARRPLRYTFVAHSQGSGWVGIGLHIFVETEQRRRGYGEGRSLLVWLTQDPKHNSDDATRLQLYRSTTDVVMTLVKEVVVPESVFDSNLFAIDVDPVQGRLSVSLNGSERLVWNELPNLADGVAVVFRALDRAGFEDFRVEELP